MDNLIFVLLVGAGAVLGIVLLSRWQRRSKRVDFAVNVGFVVWFTVAVVFIEQSTFWRLLETLLIITGTLAVRKTFYPSGAGCLFRGHDPAVVIDVQGRGVVRLHANTPGALREGIEHITGHGDYTMVGTTCERCGRIL